ncbi:hypothetical protein B0T18DRAFT_432815 [Schizothecium vesticola]|uniref:Uncharacterized protein n=1 Tax=Schizothecium vesticola TaxID=314040 RepID=A0AA40BPG5_9PEZI|nr:hypothetical protein B0T18DRAFT_432815 [Schizothecium vesticola]
MTLPKGYPDPTQTAHYYQGFVADTWDQRCRERAQERAHRNRLLRAEGRSTAPPLPPRADRSFLSKIASAIGLRKDEGLKSCFRENQGRKRDRRVSMGRGSDFSLEALRPDPSLTDLEATDLPAGERLALWMRPPEDGRTSSNTPTVCSGLDSDSDSGSFISSASSTLGSDVLPAAARYTATGPPEHDDKYPSQHITLATERDPSPAPRSTTRNLNGTARVPATLLDTIPETSTARTGPPRPPTRRGFAAPSSPPTRRGLAAATSVRATDDSRPRGVRPPGLTLPDGWRPPYETRSPSGRCC